MQVEQSQFTFQYRSLDLNVTQERGEKEGVSKASVSVNLRYTEMTLQSSDLFEDNTNAQSALFSLVSQNDEMKDFLMGIEEEGMLSLKDLGYEGKPILQLSPQEASALISDGGFFSVENTARRGADFVLSGAGEDLDMLKAGREGIVEGFAEAEKLWGGRLPDIAYETQKRTLALIDEKIRSLGANTLNVSV